MHGVSSSPISTPGAVSSGATDAGDGDEWHALIKSKARIMVTITIEKVLIGLEFENLAAGMAEI